MPSTILPHFVLCADGEGLRRALDRGGVTPFVANAFTINGHYISADGDGRPLCGAAIGADSDTLAVGPVVRCSDCGHLLAEAGQAVEVSRRHARRIESMFRATAR